MLVNIYKLKKKLLTLTQTVTCSYKRFERKQVHTIPKDGPWSVLFFGTDDFSIESLKSLHKEYESKALCRLEVVTTQSKRKNEVETYAKQNGIPIKTWPVTFNIKDYHIGVVVSFGHLIPENIIKSFPLGMINVHGSLLPKWRGAAPITYSIMNGETYTGVTIMNLLPKKFDIGEIIAQKQTNIGPDETLPELRARLARIGANLLIETLKKLPSVLSNGRPQNQMEATYAPKVTPKLSLITWDDMSATRIYNLQRALTGLYPLTTKFQDTTIKLLDVREIQRPSLSHIQPNIPGVATFDKVNNVLLVKCKDDSWISVGKISIPRRRTMDANDFSNGFIHGQKQKVIILR